MASSSSLPPPAATEGDTMEAVLDLSPEEARTYSMILDAAATLPKSDPRFALTLTFTWWLLHRRRRLEQQRVRRRQFYRRLRRLIFLRWHLQRNTLSGAAVASSQNVTAARENLAVVPEKRLWVKKEKTEDFWTKVDQNLISPEAFRKYFHMSQETFDYVYDELAEQLQKSNTSMRDPLPGKKRLAATIYRMATNAEYIKVAGLFGIGKSTTTSLVRDVCEVIVSNLKDKFLTFVGEGLNKDDMQRKINDAANSFGIPRVIGVLGSIDVLIIGSSWDWSENSPYISSYHKNYAVTFQTVVDHNGQFCNVVAGTPSSLTNRQTLDQCGLRNEFLEKYSAPSGSEVEMEQQIPIARIIADESYSSKAPSEDTEVDDSKWILTPLEIEKETEDESERQLLDEKISRARDMFDDTIMNLKSRWKIFHGKNGKINFSADAFEKIALACCILHNICALQEDEVDPSWGSDVGPEVYNRKGYPKNSPTHDNPENENQTNENNDLLQQLEEENLQEVENDQNQIEDADGEGLEDLNEDENVEEFEDELMEEDEQGEGGGDDLVVDTDMDINESGEGEHSIPSADDTNTIDSDAVLPTS